MDGSRTIGTITDAEGKDRMSHHGFALLTLSFLYHEAMDFPVCEVNKAVHLSYHSPALTVNYDPKTLPTPYFETTETPTLPTICPFPDGFLKIIGFSSISSSDSGHYCHCWMQTAGLQTNGSGVSFTFTEFSTPFLLICSHLAGSSTVGVECSPSW